MCFFLYHHNLFTPLISHQILAKSLRHRLREERSISSRGVTRRTISRNTRSVPPLLPKFAIARSAPAPPSLRGSWANTHKFALQDTWGRPLITVISIGHHRFTLSAIFIHPSPHLTSPPPIHKLFPSPFTTQPCMILIIFLYYMYSIT